MHRSRIDQVVMPWATEMLGHCLTRHLQVCWTPLYPSNLSKTTHQGFKRFAHLGDQLVAVGTAEGLQPRPEDGCITSLVDNFSF
mmetsp:Transcript_69592/g.166961  ORF Transcript_69592/g.166961 Transcript_69592/m.166961 type:complete len:84 (+) Transcript_69592:2268-2519(+)